MATRSATSSSTLSDRMEKSIDRETSLFTFMEDSELRAVRAFSGHGATGSDRSLDLNRSHVRG
jgi:hypothetical protein